MATKPRTVQTIDMPEVDVAIALMRVAHRVEGAIAPVPERGGITLQQYNVLRVLYVRAGHEGLPCSEIGERLIQRLPDVTRLLDRLEREGLVERVRCPKDRRVVRSRLTDKGHRLVEDLHEPLIAKHQELVAHMSERDIRSLLRLLMKLGGPLGVSKG